MTVKTSQDGITEMVQTEIQTMIHKETGWRAARADDVAREQACPTVLKYPG